jgi:hypothetical protein
VLHVLTFSPFLIGHPNSVCWRVKFIKVLFMQFSLSSCYFLLVFKYSRHFILKHSQSNFHTHTKLLVKW